MLPSLLLAVSLAVASSAEPQSCLPPNDTVAPLGEITFKKWFFSIYKARLYQPLGAQAAQQAAPGTELQITYLRDIDAQTLVKQTAKQWAALPLASSLPQQDWLATLSTLWPDVSLGDCLALRVTAAGHSQFYLGQQRLGTIADPRFAPTFLSIWLSANNNYPALRARLLGESR